MGNRISTEDLYKITQSLADRAVSDVKKRHEDERKREEAIKKNREERLAAAAKQNRIPNYKGGSLWDQYKAALASGEAKNANDFITKRDTRNAAWNKVGAETLNNDMEALAKSISSTYGTQFDPSKYYSQETINGSSDQVKKMRDRLNALAEYYNTYGGSDDQKKAVGEQIKAYDSELKFLGDLGAHYGQYSSPEAYETLYDNGLYTEKYQGKNYSDIQNALKSTTNDREKAWLEKNADSFMTAAEAQAEIDRIEKAMGTKNIAGQRWTTGLPKIENGKLVYNDNLYDKETGKRLQKLEAIRDSKINKETLEDYGRYLGEANEFATERALFLAKQNNILQHGNETFGVFSPDAKAPYAKNENAQNEASRLSPEKLKAVNEQSGQAFSLLENADWATDDEKKIYDYLLYYKGGDEAKKYLRALSYELNRRAANALDQTVSDMYDKASGLGKTVLNIGSLGMNIIGNPEAAIDTIAHRIVGERVDPNSNNQTFRRIRNVIREKTGADLAKASEGTIFGKDLFGQNAANMLYGAAMSSLDSLLGGFSFGEGYTAVMGGGAMADEAERLYNKGASDSQIFNRSFAAGLAEYITEKVSMDNLLKAKSPANGWQVAKEILKQAGIEGSEEMASDVLNLVADSLIMADRSDMSESIQKYKDGYVDDNGTYHKGVSEKEAQKLAWQDFFTDAMADGLAGALSGGMMSVGPTISSYKYSKNRAAIQIPSIDPGNAEGLVSNARINDISVLTDVSEALKNGDAEEAGGVISEGIAWYEFLRKYGEKTYGKNQWSEVRGSIDDSISKLKKIQKLVADGSIDAAAIDEVLKTAETSMKTTPTVDMTSANDEKLFSLLAKGEPSNSVIEKNILKDRGTLAAFERLTGLRIGGTTVSQKRADVREAFRAVSSSTETLKAAQNAIESGATATEGHKNAAVIIDQAIQANRAENSRLRNSEKVKSAETKAAIDATNRQHRFLETVRNYVINGGDLSGFTESPVADVSGEGGTNLSETKTTQKTAKKRGRADFSAYQDEITATEYNKAVKGSAAEQYTYFSNEEKKLNSDIKNIAESEAMTAEEKAEAIEKKNEEKNRLYALAKSTENVREMMRVKYAGNVDSLVEELQPKLKKYGIKIDGVDNIDTAGKSSSGAYFDRNTNTIKVSRNWDNFNNVVKLVLTGDGLAVTDRASVSFDRAVTQTIAHEIAHADSGLTLDFIKAVAGTQYDAFDLKGRLEHPDDHSWKSENAQKEENWRRYVDAYTEQAMLEMKGTEEQRRASAEKVVNDAYIFEEIMADMFGAAVDDMGHSNRAGENIFWAMNRNKPGIIRRILNALERFIARIRGKDAYLAVEQRQAAERLRDMLTGELKRAYGTEVKGEAAAESGGGKRYSITSDGKVSETASDDTSSIKEQLRNSLDTVNALESVASVEYSPTNKKELKDRAISEFRKIGFVVDRQNFGKIEIGEKQITNSLNYLNTEAEKAALLTVPKVLKRGEIISGHKDHKGRSYSTITIAAPVEINGVRGNVAATVRQTGVSRYYTHRILLPNGSEFIFAESRKNEEPTFVGMPAANDSQRSTISSSSVNSISQDSRNVNRQFSEISDAKMIEETAERLNEVSKPEKRFSLSSNVEQTKDLIAVHNMTAAELEKSLDLGGFPMPSIAIIKAADGHSEYGDTSIVFGKDTIDPKKSVRNKVYGGDAWTPEFPEIDYKANEKVGKRIRDKYYDLSKKYGYDNTRALYNYAQDLSDVLNSEGGEKAMIDKLYGDTGMMQIYLMDTGKGRVANVNKETKTALTDGQVRQYEILIDILGRDKMDGYAKKPGDNFDDLTARRRAFVKENEAGIRKAFEKTFIENGMSAKDAAEVSAELALTDLKKYVLSTFNYIKNGAETVKTEFDSEATDAAIKKAADGEGYRKWINNLFGGAEEKSGIRNSKDAYTASGNRRSFEALHWENNLENIVKAMLEQDDTGKAYDPREGMWGVSMKKYNSISEIKNDSSRLRIMNEAEHEALKEQYSARMQEIAQTLIDPKNDNYFIASDDAYSLIVDAVRNSKDESGILRYLKKYNSRATEKTASDIAALVRDIAEMPTGYFEAKPQRAVGFDEVKAVILPDNASGELISRLESDGINTVTYKAGDENSRLEALNGVRNVRFSLTRANDEYMKAVESGNVEEQQRLVDEAAENAGYDTVLYHGTQSFGFTQIDVSKYSDDGMSFFATSNPEMAQTYSAKSGTREISRKSGIENLSLPQVVDRLNAVAAADTSDYDRYTYRIMNRSDTEALKKSIQSGIKELRAETERLISEYADRLAKDFNGEDELKHSRLRSLLNALDSDSASKLSANLYTVLNHNEIFDDAAKVKFGNLEADIRLLKKLAALKTDEDVVVREDTDRYDIVVEDQEKARNRLEKLDNSGNYVLRGRTEGFLEIDGNGHNWNDIFTTLEPKGGNTLKAEYDFGSESLKLSDRDGEFAVIPAKSVADAVSPMARAFARRYGTTFATTVLAQTKDQLKNSATAEVKIKSTGKTNTRDIANFAREQGYPGVKITDIYDNGGRGSEAGRGDVYIFFNPEQDVKSADPITYDDSGNVIPLTERFDSGNRDIRWSLAGNSGITTEITDDSYDEYEGGYQRRDIKLNGETVGTVAIRIYDDYSEIDRIDIDEKYRNKGIGTTVLGDIAGEFDTTYIVPDNENAKRLYERIGEEVTSGEVYENLDQGYGVYRLDKSYGNTRWSLVGKYDYSKSFADQIDDYKNGLLPVYDTFVVSETPKVWQDIGFNALPVTLNQTHVDYALNGTKDADHEISETDLKKLPEKIKEPIAIIQSQSNPSRAVVFIEMTSKSGKNIVTPVEVDGYGKTNNLRIDSNALASVFGKKNAANQLQTAIDNTVNGKTELFYWDKKRSLALLQGAGLQLPSGLPQDGFVHSIREPGSLVKAKMDDVTNSLQFKRWFGDWKGGKRNVSKVVNRDGSPRVVYHYTDADFEAFDTSKSGSNQGVTHGDGIYVSTNPKEFAYAGKNRLDLYASIKKPFEMQLTKSQAERVYDKYFAPYHDDKYKTYRPHVIEKLQSRSRVFDYLSEAADNGKVRTSDILKELGYDGVHDGSEWVAFDSTQLKSATDNIGTFDKDNPKFRYSLAKSTQSELKALQKENEKLRQDVDDLKQELQLTHGRKLSRDALINSIQKILIDRYDVKLSAKELYPDVTNLYDMFYNNTVDGKRLKKGESVDTMRIIEEMDKIVDAVIENAVGVDDTYVEMKKLLPELRNTKLVVPMDARADAAQSAGFENWAEFRKANFGRVGFANEGIPVDTYYMELSERYPELFPDGITNPGEQAAHIADVVNTIRESGITEYQLYDIEDERIRTSIKNDVMDIIGNAEKLQTFADRAAQKVEDTKMAEAMHYGADIAKLKRLNAEKVAGIKAENRRRLSDMRRKYQDRVESVRERYSEARQNRSEKQKQTVLRNKILRKYTEASSKLYRPTTENHFTEAMRKPLMEFLAAVDITTGKSVAKQEVYDKILSVIKAANNMAAEGGKNGLDIAETDLNVQEKQLIVDSGLLERMSAWVEANQGKKLTELSSAQLEELNGIFNQLNHLTAEIKRLYDPREGLAAKSWQAQKEIGLAQTKERKQVLGAKTEKAREKHEQIYFGALDPAGYYNTLGSDTMTAQFERFRQCQNRFSENIQMFTDRLGEIVDGAIPKDEHGKNAKEVTLKLSRGTLTATPAQLMSIHLMLNQEDSRRCLFNEAGGVIIGKFTAEKPKDGKTHIAKKRTFAQSGRLVLNEADAAKITAALTDGQRKRADAISALLNNEAARLGNEVSMAMYGYKKYTTENYFPMRTVDDYRAIADNPNYEMNLLGLSFTKERTGRAGKALVAEDIYDVIGRHLTNMAQYNAFAQELDNAKKMYSLRLGDGTSLKQRIIRSYGREADAFYNKLINNLSGVQMYTNNSAEALSDKLLSNYKAAAVAGNVSVVLKQPMSIFRALPEFSLAGLKKSMAFEDILNLSPKQLKANTAEMLKYSGIARLKAWGSSENMTRKSFESLYNDNSDTARQKINEFLTSGAENADMWTWAKLWRMSKAEIDAQGKYTAGSKEYFEAVDRKFSDVIGKTQVVQSALDSSMAVQNAKGFGKFLFAFQNEPLKQYSYLISTLNDARRGKPGAKKKLAKVIASSLANTAAVSAISTFMAWLRGTLDRDDDDELLDDLMKEFAGNSIDDLLSGAFAPVWQYIDTIIGAINSGVYGNTVERLDMAALTDLGGLINKYFISRNGGRPNLGTVQDIVNVASNLFGLPAKNIFRDVKSVVDRIILELPVPSAAKYNYLKAWKDVELTNKAAVTEAYYDVLRDAVDRGRYSDYVKIKRDMIYHGYTETKIKNAVMKSSLMDDLYELKKVNPGSYKAKVNSIVSSVSAVSSLEGKEFEDFIESAMKRREREDGGSKSDDEVYDEMHKKMEKEVKEQLIYIDVSKRAAYIKKMLKTYGEYGITEADILKVLRKAGKA